MFRLLFFNIFYVLGGRYFYDPKNYAQRLAQSTNRFTQHEIIKIVPGDLAWMNFSENPSVRLLLLQKMQLLSFEMVIS